MGRGLGLSLLVGVVLIGGFIAWQLSGGEDPDRPPASGTPVAADAQFPWEMAEPPPSLIPLEEIRSGGPPPDGIPPIDRPRFGSAAEAQNWLKPTEPVVALVHGGDARAYPLQILTWHEIVNDTVGGDPITVTFCPLCNSAMAFDRRVSTTSEARALLDGIDEAVLDFGTSGRLYQSNLVMYDRQTKSLWLQFTGQGVTGPFMGTDLEFVPVQILAWRDVRSAHPGVRVLSRDTGFDRSYGRNPYVGYDTIEDRPFLFDGPLDDRMRAMDRVATIVRGDDAVAFPFARLDRLAGESGLAVVHERVGGQDIVVLFKRGAASALDTSEIAQGRDVGAVGIFEAVRGDEPVRLRVRGDVFVDEQTGSTWNILGEATSGPLAGSRLRPLHHDHTFWFVWAAFHPDARIWGP